MKIRSSLSTVLFLLALAVCLQTTASAQAVNARENRIVGLWDVQVSNLNCNTGTPLASWQALHKYELGGTAQLIPASAVLSAHVGIWRHVRGNDFELTVKEFRLDAAGNNIGWIVIKADVAISENATEYAGSGQAEVFDVNGNIVGKSCPTFTGTRFVRE